MSEVLPTGWVSTSLGEISTKPQYGWTSSASRTGSIRLLRTTDISNGRVNWNTVPFCKKSPADIDKFIIRENDILVSRAGSVGISYRIRDIDLAHKAVFASYLIRFCPYIPASYVEHFLGSHEYWEFITGSQLGIAVPNVNATKLSELYFPLPPLNEQKRIAEKLDKIIPRIDKVKERLDRIPVIIKRFRQSVLTAAVTGTLTEEWREENPDVESAEALLDKIRKFRLSHAENKRELNAINKNYKEGEIRLKNNKNNHNMPETWQYCEINSIGSVYNGSTPSRKISSYWNGKIHWVTSGEVANLRISSTRESITKAGFDNSSVKLFPKGTVLIAMIGEGKTRGQSAILDVISTCNQNVAAVIISHGFVLSEYLFNWFLMQYERNRDVGSGSGPKALNCQRVRELDFILPPLEEQKEIIRQVDKLFDLADKLEEHYQKANAKVDKLSQSVLAKAFRGELVPQWPDLPAPQPDTFWVYVIKCDNDSSYIGQTENLRKRWEEHLDGQGAEWTKKNKPCYVMYWEECKSREDVLERERELKTGFGREWIKREETAGRLWRAGEPAEKLLERVIEEKTKMVAELKKAKKKVNRKKKK